MWGFTAKWQIFREVSHFASASQIASSDSEQSSGLVPTINRWFSQNSSTVGGSKFQHVGRYHLYYKFHRITINENEYLQLLIKYLIWSPDISFNCLILDSQEYVIVASMSRGLSQLGSVACGSVGLMLNIRLAVTPFSSGFVALNWRASCTCFSASLSSLGGIMVVESLIG